MTTTDFAAADVSSWIAVLPVAATEQHGPHLPLATDRIIAEGMVAAVIERLPPDLPVTFLPVMAVGASDEHLSFPGTLSHAATGLVAAWSEIGAAVARAGLRKLVIVSAHGGNSAVMDTVALDLRLRHGLLAVCCSWSRFGQPAGLYSDRERAYGIHGGDIETSIMLHLAPHLVRREAAADFASRQEVLAASATHLRFYGPARIGWLMEDLNPAGVVGNAAAATAGKGKASVDHAADGFLALLRDVAAWA